MTFFSVVIPLYNKANYIEKTLHSVLAQSFQDFEIVVVDDGSTDKSLEIAKKINDGRIRFIGQKNSGVSVARNQGIEVAKGKYIALLDADDYWYPTHLQKMAELFATFPEAGLFCMGYERVLNDKIVEKAHNHVHYSKGPQLIEDYFTASLVNSIAWTSAVAFSKERFYEIGKFDPDLRTGQDIDFFVRSALKVPVAFDPKITMRYHKQSENNLGQTHYNNDRIYLIKKFGREEKDNFPLKRYLDRNRYAVALRCKFRDDPAWKNLVSEIDPKNLNPKQLFLLKMPKSLLQAALKTQQVLMKFGIYLTAFR